MELTEVSWAYSDRSDQAASNGTGLDLGTCIETNIFRKYRFRFLVSMEN